MPHPAEIAFLQGAVREMLVIESAGVFWLWAEMIILFAVREGRARLTRGALRPWRLRLLLWHVPFLLVFGLLLARHAWSPLLLLPEDAQQDLPEFYIAAVREHLAVWCGFVLGWVLLESVIVWDGARAYGQFAWLCRRAAVLMLFITVSIGASTASADANASELAALAAADQSLQPLRNGVYLYLRLAGVVWIAVEWVAAVLLWRGAALAEQAVARHA